MTAGQAMAETRPVKWTNVVNVTCATILVGSEAIAAGAAAGWAAAGLMRLGDNALMIALGLGGVIGLVGSVAFFRSAIRAEPFR